MNQNRIARDVKPGDKVGRYTADMDLVFVEVARVTPMKQHGRTVSYQVILKPWDEGERGQRHLRPFVLYPNNRIEVQA